MGSLLTCRQIESTQRGLEAVVLKNLEEQYRRDTRTHIVLGQVLGKKREVVAQAANAGLADVVNIDIANVEHDPVEYETLAEAEGAPAGQGPAVLVAELDGPLAVGVVGLDVVSLFLRDEVVLLCKVCVCSVLDSWIRQPVACSVAL